MSAKKKPAKKSTPVKKSGMRARGKSRLDAINHAAIANALIANNVAPSAAAKPRATSFFDGRDDRTAPLKAPGVYREADGSHTTLLLYVGRTNCQHLPMAAAGLVVAKTPIRAFREEWVSAPYDVAAAAARYLKSAEFFISTHPRAKAALDAIVAGGDEAAIKRAVDRVKVDDAAPTSGGLAGALRVAAKANDKVRRGANLPKGRGIGAWVCEQLCAKVDDTKILKEVVKKFPGAKTNASHLNWYRNKLKRDGAL